jgi:hypothetical protein
MTDLHSRAVWDSGCAISIIGQESFPYAVIILYQHICNWIPVVKVSHEWHTLSSWRPFSVGDAFSAVHTSHNQTTKHTSHWKKLSSHLKERKKGHSVCPSCTFLSGLKEWHVMGLISLRMYQCSKEFLNIFGKMDGCHTCDWIQISHSL